jgi:hypothetical protein
MELTGPLTMIRIGYPHAGRLPVAFGIEAAPHRIAGVDGRLRQAHIVVRASKWNR